MSQESVDAMVERESGLCDHNIIQLFKTTLGREPHSDELKSIKQTVLHTLQQQFAPQQKRAISSDVLAEIQTRFGYNLRPFQREALEDGVLAMRDVFLLADTNAGKSLVFTCAPLVLRSQRLPRPICICVSPLNSLMRDQVEKLNGTGVSGVHVHEITDELRRGAYDLLYVSPESLFEDDFMEMLLTPVYKDRLSLLFIDEVDCVSWQTFREFWGRLGEIRSFCPGVRVVAATATMAEWRYHRVCKLLHLANPKLVKDTGHRLNLRWSVQDRPRAWKQLLDPLAGEMAEQCARRVRQRLK